MEYFKRKDVGMGPRMIEDLGRKLLSMRTSKGLTQLEMSRLFGVSLPTYCRWERGEATPKSKQMADYVEKTVNKKGK